MVGCGKEYFTNTNAKKAKIFDAATMMKDFTDDGIINYALYADAIKEKTNEYDVVFVPTEVGLLGTLCEKEIDFDLFYPSVERRGEFIENQVRKHSDPKFIREMDKSFADWVDDLDTADNEHCFKHRMDNQGEYIGNNPMIMTYIDSLGKNDKH